MKTNKAFQSSEALSMNPKMTFGRYDFSCQLSDDALLPTYKGSTFRGVFGHALKRVVCALKTNDCKECLLRNRCLYAQVFEGAYTSKLESARISAPPKPYVIRPPKTVDVHLPEGSPFNFQLSLCGPANQELPYFVYAITEIGNMGIGKKIEGKRAGFKVKSIKCGESEIYSDQDATLKGDDWGDPICLENSSGQDQEVSRLKVTIETPLRLKLENRLQADLPFHVLVRALLRRISSLFECYGDGEPDIDYKGLAKRAGKATVVDSSLRWFDWKRYSNRQDKSMLMGGMLGSITYEGDLGEFIPLIRMGEMLHVGKQTTFGLGEIRMEALK